MTDVLILGAGSAGLSAAIYAVRAGLSVQVLEESFPGGTMLRSSIIENYPGIYPVTGAELAQRFSEHAKALGIETVSDSVLELDLEEDRMIAHALAGDYEARSLILCTGASPRKTGLPGEERFLGHGISFCAVCDGPLYRGKKVAVIGGGDSALTQALSLSSLAQEVTVLCRSEQFRAAARYQAQAEALDPIRLQCGVSVLSFEGDHQLRGLQIRKNGEISFLPADGVFLAIGADPNSRLLKGKVDTDAQGYILTDSHMRTSIPGVYACGDVRSGSIRQIISAAADGAAAVTDLALRLSERK